MSYSCRNTLGTFLSLSLSPHITQTHTYTHTYIYIYILYHTSHITHHTHTHITHHTSHITHKKKAADVCMHSNAAYLPVSVSTYIYIHLSIHLSSHQMVSSRPFSGLAPSVLAFSRTAALSPPAEQVGWGLGVAGFCWSL